MEAVEVVEEVSEVALHGRRARRQNYSSICTTTAGTGNGDTNGSVAEEAEERGGKLEKNVYYDGNGGTTVACPPSGKYPTYENLDIQKVLTAVVHGQEEDNSKTTSLSGFSAPPSKKSQGDKNTTLEPSKREGSEHDKLDLIEESDEEVLEFEFERAIEKLPTHTMYCPNCNSCITKVILCRRKRVSRIPPPANSQPDEPVDLLGCLSCFSFFIPSGNILNPFKIFGSGRTTENAQNLQQLPEANMNASSPDVVFDSGNNVEMKGNCFDLFWIFNNTRKNISTQKPQQQPETDDNCSSNHTNDRDDQRQHVKKDNHTAPNLSPASEAPINQNDLLPSKTIKDDSIAVDLTTEPPKPGKPVKSSPPEGSLPPSDVIINVEDKSGDVGLVQDEERSAGSQAPAPTQNVSVVERETQDVPVLEIPRILRETQSSTPLEILKSIVYGGLMELITSLSVVSSAAASDATTLNILAIGLANLFGGLLIMCHKLRDLRSDHSRGASGQTSGHVDRYQELLGRRVNFLLHSTFAVLSFLVFGLVPPVTYCFSFYKNDDKDMKLVAVAAASLLCIIVLAFGKAYIRRSTNFSSYIKTVLYYATAAILASGVSYVVGDQIKKLVVKLGWFESSPAANLFLPEMKSVNPAWASF